jgi:hypothetical protein
MNFKATWWLWIPFWKYMTIKPDSKHQTHKIMANLTKTISLVYLDYCQGKKKTKFKESPARSTRSPVVILVPTIILKIELNTFLMTR